MNALVFEKVGASLAAETSIGLTQDMVRIDSTNGKEDTLARDLEAKLKSLGVGTVWCADAPTPPRCPRSEKIYRDS